MAKSQVIIGPDQNQISDKAILSFTTTNQGIILPLTDNNTNITHTPGTLLFNRAQRQVQMYTDSGWLSLTGNALSNTITLPTSALGAEASTARVIIGADTSSAEGVLILEANDKALILPKVDSPQENIPSPYVGTIVYGDVPNPAGGQDMTFLFVYNGQNWHIWKAGPDSGFQSDDDITLNDL